MNGLEREVKALKRDLRAKDETVAKMEEELKRLRSRNQRSEEEVVNLALAPLIPIFRHI